MPNHKVKPKQTHLAKIRHEKRLKAFGLHLRRLREGKKLSQEEVADYAGISFSSLNTIENGKVNPTLATLIAISESLKTPLKDLCDF